jgi:hypothetical protein
VRRKILLELLRARLLGRHEGPVAAGAAATERA